MSHARARLMSIVTVLVAATSVAAASLAAPGAAQGADAAQMLPAQTLFLTERFSAAGPARAPLTSGPLPEHLVALRGEREGFQVVVRNDTGAGLQLGARVVGDVARQVEFELLRVGFVHLPQGSKGMGTGPGMYPDPLPPFVNSNVAAGRLSIAPGQWGGLAVIAKVRTTTNPGAYAGALELFSGAEGQGETVHSRVGFTLDVRGHVLLQPGGPKSFKTVLNVEGDAYWLQHSDMRDRLRGSELWADRMAQLGGLMSFLDSRNVTPLELPFAHPSADGRYGCSYSAKGVAPQRYIDQLKGRYFGKARDIDPTAAQFPARMVPSGTIGCMKDSRDTKPVGFKATVDTFNTPTIRQDDTFNAKAPSFLRSVAGAWSGNGLWKPGGTYVKNPFDEPGHATAAQKRTMNLEVPKANVALHRAFGAKAKVVISSWPRDGRNRRVCRKYGSGQRCTTLSGDDFDNRKMWDARGADDVDVWMPQFARLFGRTTPPRIARDYKVNRTRDYANRLRSIRNRKAGRETWAYNFFTATKTMPQVTIDAPGTDPRLQYLMLARDGHTGLFISNLMMGWGTRNEAIAGSSPTVRRKGNPYDQALYFQHRKYGYAAGWGTFIYPGYAPQLGLDGEERRNSEGSVPVSSLRLEGLRDGTEDANLIQMYRARHGRTGDAKVNAALKRIFPGRSVNYPRTLGNVVGPYYSNGANLAQRMEISRRQMIDGLG